MITRFRKTKPPHWRSEMTFRVVSVSGTLFLLHLITITLSCVDLHFTHTVTLVHAHDHMSYACPGLCTDSIGI